MGADTSAQATSLPHAVRERLVAVVERNERSFWLGLACAAVLHLALLVGVVRHLPSQMMMGEQSGRPDGISVELIDKADLEAKNTFAEEGAGNPAPQPPPPPPKIAALPQPPAPTPAPKQTPPAPAEEPVQKSAPPAEPPEAAQRPPAQAKTNPWSPDVEAIDQAAPLPADQPKRADAPEKAPPKKQQPLEQAPPPQPKTKPQEKPQDKLALNFELPPQAFAPGTTGAAVMRPPGITRSGENDEFARGVIRALRRTMPTSNMLGQVTVRFMLSETGNLVEVRVVAPSRDPVFDQNIAFSVRQASFPIPPAGSKTVDRMFQVTYIYH